MIREEFVGPENESQSITEIRPYAYRQEVGKLHFTIASIGLRVRNPLCIMQTVARDEGWYSSLE
jgi:hypothetical protein